MSFPFVGFMEVRHVQPSTSPQVPVTPLNPITLDMLGPACLSEHAKLSNNKAVVSSTSLVGADAWSCRRDHLLVGFHSARVESHRTSAGVDFARSVCAIAVCICGGVEEHEVGTRTAAASDPRRYCAVSPSGSAGATITESWTTGWRRSSANRSTDINTYHSPDPRSAWHCPFG